MKPINLPTSEQFPQQFGAEDDLLKVSWVPASTVTEVTHSTSKE
uniref:Uncharacterized protein n=1 Tax=Anguilla anguilla TaxID=7936 RepID=A0A0E9QFT7_ANGAN